MVVGVILYFNSSSFLVFLQNKPKQKSIKISPREAIILEVVEFVKTLQTNEVSTKLDKSVLTTAISSGPVILLDIDHMQKDWQNALQVIFERSRITARYPVKIDLRFQSPILTYGQE